MTHRSVWYWPNDDQLYISHRREIVQDHTNDPDEHERFELLTTLEELIEDIQKGRIYLGEFD